MSDKSDTGFVWEKWNDFFDNINMTHDGQRYLVECKKGLWSVVCPELKQAVKEAARCFYLYSSDGECDERITGKLNFKLLKK